ncbi:N-acetylmuramoyl-L-alanine amidase [Desulfococcaceae bacterium HSG8]|nr:N-acetylmuramoyl-L-alanine amidase [Desulfococcaceae bacterium HSG8]
MRSEAYHSYPRLNSIFHTCFFFICCIINILCPNDILAITAEEQFYKAEVAYRKFLENHDKLKYRENWLVHVEEFRAAHKLDPSSSLAPAALYMSGEVYKELYKRSFKPSDKKEAIDAFKRLLKRYPRSVYRRKAKVGIKALSQTEPEVKVKKAESGKAKKTGSVSYEKKHKAKGEVFRRSKDEYKKRKPRKSYASSSNKSPGFSKPTTVANTDTTITNLRFWSNPSYTRVVIDADNETSYAYKLLKKDASNPYRLYIDFNGSRLGKSIKRMIPINDDLLIDARASQFRKDSVRVVVDIKSFGTYKIFSLRNPFRTIIDVWGGDNNDLLYAKKSEHKKRVTKKRKKAERRKKIPQKKPEQKIKPTDIAKSLALGVRRIVIDPGHGGKDAGATGYNKKVLEKNVALSIAKRLARKIRRKLGCEVIMTRRSDRFLSLEERTAIANTRNADLFISIHTNAHKNKRAYGIETYFLNLATDDDAIRVAARENAISRKNISDLQVILQDLMQNAKINESSRLATHVQRALYQNMKKNFSKIKNKGVKQAPFYVLLGAQMPSILIETSFISNKRECSRLTNGNYQEHLCNAILKGIREYIKETNPMALWRLRPDNNG